MNQALTAERLRETLHYDPETGVFTWLVDRGGARRGSVAGCVNKAKGQGYRVIGLDGAFHRAHRLAWFYSYGAWPSNHIDHIDGDRTNNVLSNLRECVWAENQQNRGVQRNNAAGLMGVHWEAYTSRWKAQIQVSGRNINLGRFDTPEEAHAAYLAAKQRLHVYQPTPRATGSKASNDQAYRAEAHG